MINRLRDSRSFYILLSILLAVLVWLYIRDVENPTQDGTYYGIEIQVSGERVLEERGLIEKKVADGIKKHIDVYLSASAQPIIAEGLEAQRQFARDMFQGLSEPQIAACKQAFQKICDNAEECLKIKGMTHHES